MIYLVVYEGLELIRVVEKAFYLYSDAFNYCNEQGWQSEIYSRTIEEVQIG